MVCSALLADRELNTQEAAEFLGLSARYVRRLGDQDRLPFWVVNKRGDRRYYVEDLRDLLLSRCRSEYGGDIS